MQPKGFVERLDPIAGDAAVDAEQGLIGTLLTFPQALDSAREALDPADFVEDAHRRIVAAMCEMHDCGAGLSIPGIVTITGNISVQGKEMRAYLLLLRLDGSHESPAAIPYLLTAVRRAANMRAIETVTQTLVNAMDNGTIVDPVPVATEMIEHLDRVVASNMRSSAKRVTLGSASREAMTAALMAKANDGTPLYGVKTGIPTLDAMLGYLKPGMLIIGAGRPAMGKTAMAVTIGLNAARAGVNPDGEVDPFRACHVYMASLEMTAVDLAERAIVATAATWHEGHLRCSVAYEKFARGDFSDADEPKLWNAADFMAKLPFEVEQQSGLSVGQLIARMRQSVNRARQKGIKNFLAIIDYLGLVRATDRYQGSKVNEIGEITAALKVAAKELGVAILLLCQLSRKVEDRPDRRPIMSDLRDSGAIEQDADAILGFYRNEYYLLQIAKRSAEEEVELQRCMGTLEIGILKQRKGPTGWVTCGCDITTNTVYELRGQS